MPEKETKYSGRLLYLAGELIKIPSIAGRESMLIERVAEELRKVDFTVQYQPVLGAGGANLVASKESGGP